MVFQTHVNALNYTISLLDQGADPCSNLREILSNKDNTHRSRLIINPVPMLGWAAIIVVLLIVSALPFFLGLLVTLPVLGHTTWHLYRRLVAPPAG